MPLVRLGAVRLLLLENDPADAELIAAALRRHGLNGSPTLVTTREEFIAALRAQAFDVVLSDYRLPGWTGMGALGVLRGMGFDTPLILLTGTLGDEQAVDCVREGVSDYVLKNNLGRLAVAIPRVLDERRQREGMQRAREAVRHAEDLAVTAKEDSEQWFRALIENSADGIALLTADGRFRYLSPSTERLLGVKAETLIGTNFGPLVHPDDIGVATATFQAVVAEAGSTGSFQCRAKHSDGTWRWFDSQLTNRLDDARIGGIVSNFRDITDRHNADAALRESERRFREIAEHIKEAFFVVDLETYRTLYVSPTWGEIWGRPMDVAYDPQIWMNAVHPDDRGDVIGAQEEVRAGRQAVNVFRVRRPDGVIRWVRGRVYPVTNAAGKVTRMVGVSSDITELRDAEARFQQAQKMEAMGRLAGGVAHDFNNMLTVIIGLADQIQADTPAGHPIREMARDIFDAGESAAVLTRQLLAFSRKQMIEPVVVPVNDAINDTLKMLRRMIGEDVTLETKLAPDAGTVRADRGQLEQLLTNLAVNARDAMPAGGVLIVATSATTVAAVRGATSRLPPGVYATISVTDTGSGMTEEVQAHIFEPFFTTKEAGKGTGLGLATVHGIVEQAGGHVTVESKLGGGTTFHIHLPRVSEKAGGNAAAADEEVRRGHETILIVEDEEIVRRAACRMLRSLGYETLDAADAKAAQRLLAERGKDVRLMITDVVLPGITGRELAEVVAATYPSIKILFASGYNDDVILQHRLLAHHIALLPKPYTMASLAKKVRDVLDG